MRKWMVSLGLQGLAGVTQIVMERETLTTKDFFGQESPFREGELLTIRVASGQEFSFQHDKLVAASVAPLDEPLVQPVQMQPPRNVMPMPTPIRR